MTVEECLEHPYLSSYHDPQDEPSSSPLSPTYFDFDHHKDRLSKDQLKELLYEEVLSFSSVINDNSQRHEPDCHTQQSHI
jgi:mitogen-activated protein kinase 1/3